MSGIPRIGGIGRISLLRRDPRQYNGANQSQTTTPSSPGPAPASSEPVKAVLFDCWDTLFYTTCDPHPIRAFSERIGQNIQDPVYRKQFERAFQLNPITDWYEPTQRLLSELRLQASPTVLKELVDIFREGLDCQAPFPDSLETLARLGKSYKLGLVTNVDSLSYARLNRVFGVERLFDAVVPSFRVHDLKPGPIIYQAALRQLSVSPSQARMVGDSIQDDLNGANKHGIKAILIDRNGKYADFLGKITSLDQLDKYLK